MRKNFLFWFIGVMFPGLLEPAISTMAAQSSITTRPAGADTVPSGKYFLVRLDGELNTKDKVNKKFHVTTLEPLETSSSYILAPGAKMRGHISRTERGGITARAGLWLAFDDIETHHARLPIVAEVFSVPGDFSVRPGAGKDGEIEARTRKSTQELEAAAGAALGAAAVVSAHGGVGAVAGGAAGGAAGYAASSSNGQKVDLQKSTKLDLVLEAGETPVKSPVFEIGINVVAGRSGSDSRKRSELAG